MFPEKGFLPQGSYLHIHCKNADSGLNLQINGLFETIDGLKIFRENWKPATSGDLVYHIPLTSCIIHNLTISNQASINLNSNYPIEIYVTLGGPNAQNRVATLIYGFLDPFMPICYPEIYVDPELRLFRGNRMGASDPAAGNPWITNGAATMILRPKYLGGQIICGAGVANRNLYLLSSFSGSTPSGYSFSSFNMVANNTYNFAFNLNCPLNTNQGNNLSLYLPDCVIGSGGKLEVGAINIQAADQIQNMVCIFESIEC
jgi:hypothetical protein